MLAVLLLAIPHHRLIIWLSDSLLVKYWKEIIFAAACLSYASVVVRRRGLTRLELSGVMWAFPFVLAVLVRLVGGLLRQEDRYLLFVGGGSHVYYVPIFLLTIYLLETSRREPPRQVKRMLYWVLIATTMGAVLSILDNLLQFSGSLDSFPGATNRWMVPHEPSIWRSVGTYQSPMVLGLITGTGFLICLHSFVTRLANRPLPWKGLAAFGALMVLHLSGLYLTFSRGPLVATTGGAVIIGLFGAKGLNRRTLTARWRTAVAGVVGVIAVVTLLILLVPSTHQRRLGSIFDWTGDVSNVNRIRRMTWGLETFLEDPWIGQGIGTAQARLSTYRVRELDQDEFFVTPESQLLVWSMEGGLLMLVPALLIVGFMIHTALAMASGPYRADVRRLGVLFLGLQTALYAEALIMPILNNRTFQLGFWVLFGVLVLFRGELEGAKADADAQMQEARIESRPREAGA